MSQGWRERARDELRKSVNGWNTGTSTGRDTCQTARRGEEKESFDG